MMRIVIATTTAFHLHHLAKELRNLGQNVHFMSYAPRFRMTRDRISPDWSTSAFVPSLPTSALAQFRYWPKLQRRAVERMMAVMDDYVAEHMPPCDVFIGLSSMAVRSAKLAREKYGARVVIERGSRHILANQQARLSGNRKPLSDFYVERELASYEAADTISLLSGHSRASFVERGFAPGKLFTNPLGVDLNRFVETARPEGQTRILFVGGWSYHKGVDLLVEALRQRPQWTLTHAGTINDIEFPKGPQFTTRGHLDHAALAKCISEHHLLVLPSREDGFGMVLLEALASGLPVVASTMSGGADIQELMTNKEYVGLFEAGSAPALLNALDEIASLERESPEDRHRLTASDRETLSWKGYAQRYLAFLQAGRNDS